MAISYIGGASGTNTATLPAHQVGDLILAFAFRDGTNALPGLPEGWTILRSRTGGANGAILAVRIAADGATDPGTWSAASSVMFTIYRASGGSITVGEHAIAGFNSAGFYYPGLTLQDTEGLSWVAAFVGHRSTDTDIEIPPAGMVNRINVVDGTDEASAHDTDGPFAGTVWSTAGSTTGGTTAGYSVAVVEIMETGAGPRPIASDDFRRGDLSGWGRQLSASDGVTPIVSAANDGADWWARITLPAEGSYDSWTGTDRMPRIVQDASGLGTDWTVTVKFAGDVGTTATQSQGLWIGGAAGHWLRWEQLGRDGRCDLFAGRCSGAAATQILAANGAGAGACWLRVTRNGGWLDFYSSIDGATWDLRGSDSAWLAASEVLRIGIHGGRTGAADALVIDADWFEIGTDPIAGEDEGEAPAGTTLGRATTCAASGTVAAGRIVTARRAASIGAASGAAATCRVVHTRSASIAARSAIAAGRSTAARRAGAVDATGAMAAAATLTRRRSATIAAASGVMARPRVTRARVASIAVRSAAAVTRRTIRRRTVEIVVRSKLGAARRATATRAAAIAAASALTAHPRRIATALRAVLLPAAPTRVEGASGHRDIIGGSGRNRVEVIG